MPRPLLDPRVQVLLATVFVLAASLLGIGRDLFWEDEANTVLFARNLLEQGHLAAWDGRNVIGYAGGTELSRDLINVVMPPLQYYLTAAGMAVLGDGELAARLPSVLLGGLAVLVLGWAARGFLSEQTDAGLPAVLMALSAAFLLFVPHARYFAAGIVLAALLLGIWGRLAADGTALNARFTAWVAGGAGAATALFYANYLMAPAMIGTLAPLLVLPRFRTRRHLVFLAALGALGLGLIALTFGQAEIAQRLGDRPAVEAPVQAALVLLGLYVSSLSAFEFLPVLLLPVLVLPWVSARCAAAREDAMTAIALLLGVFVYIVLIAVMTLRPVSPWDLGDMRYAVPLFPVIAIIAAVALRTAWRASRALALGLFGLLVFSNVLHLAPLSLAETPPFRCTLCLVVAERLGDTRTGTEGYVAAAARTPPGASVFVFPQHMAYGPMYYLPDRRYCAQLDPDVIGPIADAARFGSCIVKGTGCADFAVIGGLSTDHPEHPKPRSRMRIGACPYRLVHVDPVHWRDGSRPEIPRHAFDTPAPRPYEEYEILTYARIGPENPTDKAQP